MGFKEVSSLDADTAISLGGVDKKTNKKKPTQAEGYYLGSRVVDGKKGESTLHFLQTEAGNLGVWGKTDMDRKLKTVKPGTMVRISYTGMQNTKNGDMYKFKVEVDSTNTIDVADLSAQEASGDDFNSDNDAYSADGEGYNSEGQEEDDDNNEDAAQAAALAAAERKAKVQAMLSKGKKLA